MKFKVIDNQTGQESEIDDVALPVALKGDRYSVVDEGQQLEFEDNRGERRIVPVSQAFDAIDANYKLIDSAKQKREADLLEAADSPLLSAGVSLASGISLGITDQILKRTGLLSSQELSDLREANPVISTTAEIAGGILPMVASGGTGIVAKGLAATPAALAELAGKKAVEKIGGKILANTTSKVAQAAVKTGVGSAVEGSFFGAGRLLTEEALGDAEFNAENLVSYAGLGGLTGGALGAGVGATAAGISKGVNAAKNKIKTLEKSFIDKNLQGELRQNVINKIEIDNAVDDYAQMRGIDTEDLAKQYDESVEFERSLELQKAAENIGVPLTEGMKAGGTFAELEGSLAKSKSIAGDLTRKEIDKTYDALEAVSESFLKGATDIDPTTLGMVAKEGIAAKISEDLLPSEMIYRDLKKVTQDVEVDKRVIDNYVAFIGDDFLNRVSGDGETWLKKVGRIRTIDDVTKLRSMVGAEIAPASRNSPVMAEYLDKLYDDLTELRAKALQSIPDGFYGNSGMDKASALSKMQEADKNWRNTALKYEFLGKQIGLKAKSPKGFIAALSEIQPEKIADKILAINNKESAEKISQYFPEVYEMARARKLSDIAKKSTVKGEFSPAKFYSQVNSLPQQQLDILFPNIKNPKEVLRSYQKVVDALPPLTNPSGTAYELALQNMLTLGYQAQEAARFAAYKLGSKKFGEKLKAYVGDIQQAMNKDGQKIVSEVSSEASVKLPYLQEIEKASNKGKLSISDAVEGFFKSSKKAAETGLKGAERYIISQAVSQQKAEEIEKKMEMYGTNPDAVVENFMKSNRDMIKAAPKTAEATSKTILNAVNFLRSKVPKRDPSVFNDTKIGKSDILKFKAYSDAVEDPFSSIEAIKKGYITPEAVEAFRVVYPKIFQALKDEFAGRIPEFKNITEKQKADLSRLLGLDAKKAYTPQGFATLQAGSRAAIQQAEAPQKVPMTAARNLRVAQRTQTGLDRTLYRA